MPVCTKSVHHGWSDGACTWCEEPVHESGGQYDGPQRMPGFSNVSLNGLQNEPDIEGVPLAIHDEPNKPPPPCIGPRIPFNQRRAGELYMDERGDLQRYTVGVDYGFSPASVVLLKDCEMLVDAEVLGECMTQIRDRIIAAFDGQLVASLRPPPSAETERMAREIERTAQWLRFGRWLSKQQLVFGDGS